MKYIFQIVFLVFSFSGFSQPEVNIEELKYPYISESIFSSILQDSRKIKIYLPDDYEKEKKYPVIYVLDADWMFEPTIAETKILSDFDIIPKSIVVGVFHNNRNEDLGLDWKTGEFSESSSKFYGFLTNELVSLIDSSYSTSTFNTLIGHSNSATYCHKVLTQENQPFNGFVALSQNLFGNQFQEYINFTKVPFEDKIFYFVASGYRDATPRLESGMELDSLFQLNQNHKLKTKHSIYDADHSGIAGKGLNDGISFIFSDYIHYNDWNEKLIDSLSSNGINSINFINHHSHNIKNIYGVEFNVNRDDLSLMQALTNTESEIKAIQDFEIQHFGKDEHFYATYAQFYEYIKSYDKALEFWNKNLEGKYVHNENFFYFRRPIELLNEKMKQPKRAIDYTQKLLKQFPDKSLYLNYMIAKIASENNINKREGLNAITLCIQNYKSNKIFDLEQAQQLKKTLTQ